MEDIVQKALLFDFYGELLTDRQKNIVEMYYNADLSLSEISEQIGISRQGVYDALKRAEATLEEYESRLGLVEKFLYHKTIISVISNMLDEIIKKDYEDITDIKWKINKVKKYIEKLE